MATRSAAYQAFGSQSTKQMTGDGTISVPQCWRTGHQSGRVAPFYPPPAGHIDTPWTITVYDAHGERARWDRYNQCANRSYAARGLQAVGEEQVIDIDRYPTYFAEATLRAAGHEPLPIGGVRIHLPDGHGHLPLFHELAGFVEVEVLNNLVQPLRSDGVAHGGGLWIDAAHRRSGLASDLARACNALIAAARVRWYVAATHQHILGAWCSLGWHPVASIPTFAYPDERYRSCVLLGDRLTWPADLAEWADAQVDGATSHASGARFVVRPMRSTAGPNEVFTSTAASRPYTVSSDSPQ